MSSFNRFSSSRGLTLAAAVLAATVVAGLADTASATVIYQDNFSGTATTPLAGTVPTTDTGSSSTWSNQWGTAWKANGSVAVASATDLEVASLKFTPTTGKIYTLSISLNPTSYGNFMAFGFTNGDGTGAPFYNTTGPWLNVYGASGSSGVAAQAGPGTSNTLVNAGVSSFNQPAQIVLNTAGTDWTVQWSYNGSVLKSYAYTGISGSNPNPTGITQVAIRSDGDNGTVSNFLLTESAVPEPASMGLLVAGGLGLLLLRRRRAV
jgi:hypothetical protein